MNIRKRIVTGIMFAGMTLGILAGCGAEKPTDTADGFLTSIQKGDFEKAGTYVEGGTDSLKTDEDSTADDEFTISMIEEISKNYKFEKPVEVSVSGDKAVVEAKITSVDFGDVMTSTMAEVMPLAFASAFEEQTPESEKAFEDLMEKTTLKHLKSEDVTMATRTVKLNLEKNKDGVYKIVNDDSLTESIFANLSKLEDMFGEGDDDAVSEEVAEEQQPEQTSDVISEIAKDQKYDVNPINVNVKEVSFKKASNVSEEEQENISYLAEKEVGSEFNYLYVSYNAENTSDEDYEFSGISQVVLFANGKQEVLERSLDFIDYDEDQDGAYYGKVNKDGEVGFVIDTDPSKVEKVRLVIGDSMKSDTYDGGTDEQIVEFDLSQK
jgi:hypothetical protein